ncbi:hypothetical protein VCSRO104_3049 [Vibrio cholerae]|nr:hypothetical protein VCSRO104_3049 [Vibrio cholerae]
MTDTFAENFERWTLSGTITKRIRYEVVFLNADREFAAHLDKFKK